MQATRSTSAGLTDPALGLRRSWQPVIQFMATVVAGLLLLVGALQFVDEYSASSPEAAALVIVLLLALDAIALWYLRRGSFRESVALLVVVLLAGLGFGIQQADPELRVSLFALYTLPIALAALLLGRRALVITLLISAASTLLLSALGQDGTLAFNARESFSGTAGSLPVPHLLLLLLIAIFLDRFSVALQRNVAELIAQEQLNVHTNMSLQQEIEERRLAEEARVVALEREREAREQAELANQRSWFLADLGLLLSSAIEFESTVARVPAMLASRFGDWATLDLLDEEGRLQRASAAHRDPNKQKLIDRLLERHSQLQIYAGLAGEVLTRLEPVLVRGVTNEIGLAIREDEEYRRLLEGLGYGSALLIPLAHMGNTLGVISLIDHDENRPFTEEDRRFFAEVGRRAAAAVANAQLYSQAVDQNEELERRVGQRTAQLQAANSELEAFTYSASHDLRAPLRGIDGFSQALEEDYGHKLDETALGYITRIRNGARRMGTLIDDLLSLSRLTQSAMTRREVDLSELAEGILRDLADKEPQRDVTWDVAPGMIAQADRQLLLILFENLLGNSWKFTEHTPDARIEVGVRQEGGEAVYFVRDNGAGFNMDYAAKLFAPFQRLHTAEEFAGSGIGLATVYRIVRRHDGRIWAEGAVGSGAAFHFTLAPAE